MPTTSPPPAAERGHAAPATARAGWVYLVGAGPGDPGLITLRGAELLASADLVVHSEPVAPGLLAMVRSDAEVRSLGRRGQPLPDRDDRHAAIAQELAEAARAGRSVVRLHGGDSLLFSRGIELALSLEREGVPFQVVPGVTSPVAAAAYAGMPLTRGKLAESVTFVAASDADDEPFDWQTLQGERGTVCVLMAERNLDTICRALVEQAGFSPSAPAALVEWASLPEQRTFQAPLSDLPARAALGESPGPAVLFVGPVTTLGETLGWFERQPLFGKRILLARPAHQAAPTIALLRSRGASVWALPTIAIEPPADPEPVRRAVGQLGRYDVVIFTSANGVTGLWQELERLQRDARAFGRARIAAIGPGTARALRARGLRADIVPQHFVAEQLAQALLEHLGDAAASSRVLLVRALVAREVLPEMLREAGVEVDVVPVYRTVPASAERAAELREAVEQGEVDAVMLTSSSTAEQLCTLLGADAPALLSRIKLASIGPITSARAAELGLDIAITAETSTLEGLVDAMERAFTRGPV